MTWEGYDEDFLGVPAPIPRPLDGREVRELAYPRFTVLLDPRRRFAVSTAVAIDGGSLQEILRQGRWRLDTRIARREQAGAGIYAKNDLDRGHLVRRSDPGWGTVEEALEATTATFYYPNAAPQASGFNQSKELWVGLEDHVLQYADAADLRVAVFTAPVLDDDDPPYKGIQIPRRFWKIAAWSSTRVPEEPVLAATGFVLDQSELIEVEDGLLAVEPLGAFRTFQSPIADIADLAGIDAGPLVDADVLVPPGLLSTPKWHELGSAADITLA